MRQFIDKENIKIKKKKMENDVFKNFKFLKNDNLLYFILLKGMHI